MNDDWEGSAKAWIALVGDGGDFSRAAILDAPMLTRVRASGARSALDVGCGEGRFCRMMADAVPEVSGLDPTEELLQCARELGVADYVRGRAEAMPFADGAFDLVVSYLTLIDIDDANAGLAEMVRVLRPGGRILIANLNSWITSAQTAGAGWNRHDDGSVTATMDRYFEPHAYPAEWAGIRVRNWHRPMRFYMQALLDLGLTLTHFDEPEATGGRDAERHNRAPYLVMMEWQKPAA